MDEQTAFVDVDEKTLYTGFENVPDYRNGTCTDYVKFWAIDSTDDGVLDAVFIYGGVASNSNKTYFYVADWEAYESYDKNKMYKEATVYVDGEKTTLIFTADAHQEITTGKSGPVCGQPHQRLRRGHRRGQDRGQRGPRGGGLQSLLPGRQQRRPVDRPTARPSSLWPPMS